MNVLVIDASISAKWHLSDELDAEHAVDMLRDYAAGTIAFIAPRVWQYETANIFNKAVGVGRVTETEGQDAVDMLYALDIELIDFLPPAEAYTLARTYQRSVYDSLYLATAETNGIELWTGDRRLYNAVVNRLPFVKWIGDYPTSASRGQ